MYIFHNNIVLTIGNTGSGKSTLLASLLEGTNLLEEKNIEEKKHSDHEFIVKKI